MLVLIIRVAAIGVDVPGYASLIVVVLFMDGIQMLAIGNLE
jgi:hypothetical protein